MSKKTKLVLVLALVVVLYTVLSDSGETVEVEIEEQPLFSVRSPPTESAPPPPVQRPRWNGPHARE